MKKCFALTLVLMMLVLLCPSLSAADTGNLLVNGDFENGSSSWGHINGNFSTITNESVGGNTGNKLKLTRTSTESSDWVYQRLLPPKYTPGATYYAKFDFCGDLSGSGGLILQMKYYKTNSPEYRDISAGSKLNTNGKWNTVTLDFTVPEDCNEEMRLWIRLYGAATVYVDNVELYETAGPDAYFLNNSTVFHYDGKETGTLSARLFSFYDETHFAAKSLVTFSLSDKEKELKKVTLPFTGRIAEFHYKAGDYLSEARKECTYAIRVHSPEGELLKERTGTLYLVPRPSRLDETGNYIINGEVFNPVFGYHVSTPSDDAADEDNAYKAAKEAGLNVVMVTMTYSRWLTGRNQVNHVLKQLDKYDLYGIFCLYDSVSDYENGGTKLLTAGHPNEIANTRAMAENLANEKRVFAWALMDEPFGKEISPEREAELELAYKEIRARDTMHPIYCVDYEKGSFYADIKYCDIFAPDPYSPTQTYVSDMMQYAMEVAEPQNKPVYAVLGTYTRPNSTPTTPELVRHHIYQALFAGAKGIGYYSFDECGETGKEVLWKTDLFEGIVQIGKELPILFETMVGKPYTEVKNDQYIMRTYANGKTAILSLATDSPKIALEKYRGVRALSGESGVLLRDKESYFLLLGQFTAALFEYTSPIQVWKDGVETNKLSDGTYSVTHVSGSTDLYIALYAAESGELVKLYVAKNKAGGSMKLTVPSEGQYKMKVFAFSPGTLLPVAKAVTLQ
ncbi:MAG: carbohydrate binding domain-containing protein [Clostridia bacterium]|nr:carbohydrate binding domain-containing protein [Clostridia bacterium]